MLVSVHKKDEFGNVFTLRNCNGLRIKWQGKRLKVPYGFESDWASVPRFFWRFIFPSSDTTARRAAFAHDFVYRTHPEGWTKKDADEMFMYLLIEDGVSEWRAWLAWLGVHWFGGYAWKTHGGMAA